MVCKTINCYFISNTPCYSEVWRRFQIWNHYWSIPLMFVPAKSSFILMGMQAFPYFFTCSAWAAAACSALKDFLLASRCIGESLNILLVPSNEKQNHCKHLLFIEEFFNILPVTSIMFNIIENILSYMEFLYYSLWCIPNNKINNILSLSFSLVPPWKFSCI